MTSKLCQQLGIEFPLFAFSHCRDVVAAVRQAGGFGGLGANDLNPEQLAIDTYWSAHPSAGKRNGPVGRIL